MLSVKEMQARLKLLQEAGDVSELCRIQVREMPLVTAGEDASEYIPFAIHPDVAGQLGLAVRRLREHMVRYIIEGTTVSAHKLPQQDDRSRAMMQALRANQPQISGHLMHHWCADEQGVGALRGFLHDNWLKAWKSERRTSSRNLSPVEWQLQWLGAINTLMLGLIRQEIQRLPDEHAEMTDLVMVNVLGASFHWLIQEFADQFLAELDDAVRAAVIQRLSAPAPALAFFRRQPKGRMFADAAHMVTTYGLETELLPRMRQAYADSAGESASVVLAELTADSITDHLLKRSWVRLSLRQMGEETGQGGWSKWALDAKRLDQLLSAPEKVVAEMQTSLNAVSEHPFAVWLLGHEKKGFLGRSGQDDKPWRQDERLLQVFLLFEEDAKLEQERREAGQRWLNREAVLVGEGRGSEAGRILIEAHGKGKIVLLQKDNKAPLFVAGGAEALQGVLYIDWTEFLRSSELRCGPGMKTFLERTFQPGIEQLVKSIEDVFADSFSASGLLLRGSLPKLLLAGVALRQLMGKWFEELGAASEGTGKETPIISMCLAVHGEWAIAKQVETGLGGRLAFSRGLAQAKSAVSRNDGLRRLLLSFDERDGKRPLGGVRVETMKMADGKRVPILSNQGFALTGSALQALRASTAELHMQAFQAPENAAVQGLTGFRLPGGRPEGFLLHVVGGAEAETDTHLLLRIGKALLGTSVEGIYEVMDPEGPGYKPLSEASTRWLGSAES